MICLNIKMHQLLKFIGDLQNAAAATAAVAAAAVADDGDDDGDDVVVVDAGDVVAFYIYFCCYGRGKCNFFLVLFLFLDHILWRRSSVCVFWRVGIYKYINVYI